MEQTDSAFISKALSPRRGLGGVFVATGASLILYDVHNVHPLLAAGAVSVISLGAGIVAITSSSDHFQQRFLEVTGADVGCWIYGSGLAAVATFGGEAIQNLYENGLHTSQEDGSAPLNPALYAAIANWGPWLWVNMSPPLERFASSTSLTNAQPLAQERSLPDHAKDLCYKIANAGTILQNYLAASGGALIAALGAAIESPLTIAGGALLTAGPLVSEAFTSHEIKPKTIIQQALAKPILMATHLSQRLPL